jgi:hypothetical protein
MEWQRASIIGGLEKATRGGWMRVNQNSLMELDLYPKIDPTSSLLTRPRLHSYRKTISPRNRIKNRSKNTDQCCQEHVWNWWQKSDQNSVYVLTDISSNTFGACSRTNHLRAIRTRKSRTFYPIAQEWYRLHPTTIHTQHEQFNTSNTQYSRTPVVTKHWSTDRQD